MNFPNYPIIYTTYYIISPDSSNSPFLHINRMLLNTCTDSKKMMKIKKLYHQLSDVLTIEVQFKFSRLKLAITTTWATTFSASTATFSAATFTTARAFSTATTTTASSTITITAWTTISTATTTTTTRAFFSHW